MNKYLVKTGDYIIASFYAHNDIQADQVLAAYNDKELNPSFEYRWEQA